MTEISLDGVIGDSRKRIEGPIMLVSGAYYLGMAGNRLELLQQRRTDLLLEHWRIMGEFYNVTNAIEDLRAEINETERGTMP